METQKNIKLYSKFNNLMILPPRPIDILFAAKILEEDNQN